MDDKQIVGICCGRFGDPMADKLCHDTALSLVDGMGFKMERFCKPVEEVAKIVMGGASPTLQTIDGVCRTGRMITENYWLNIAASRIDPSSNKIVFCDVFFSNESRYIRASGGMVIKIKCDSVPDGDFDFEPDATVQYGSECSIGEDVKKIVASFFDASNRKVHIIAKGESQQLSTTQPLKMDGLAQLPVKRY